MDTAGTGVKDFPSVMAYDRTQSYDAAADNIVLRNISFTPGKAGTYKLVVRAFNLANVSSATVSYCVTRSLRETETAMPSMWS